MKLRELFKRALQRFISEPSIYFSSFTYPSKGLTPEKLASLLREADEGNVYRQMELFCEMEEKDTHLMSVAQTRKLALCGLDFEIVPVDDSRKQKKIVSFLKEKIDAIENFDEGLFDLMDAVSKGFSVLEIIYEYADGEIWVKNLEFVEQRRFTFMSRDGVVLSVPRILTEQDMVYGEELVEDKFIYFRHKARSGLAPRGGLLRPCAWMYLFKNYTLKDWVIFCERYAMPMRIGKYHPGASEDEIDVLKKAILQLGADGAAVISDNTLIELIESKARGGVGAYEKLSSYCDRQMSKAFLGQTLTTEPGSSGSYALGKVQQQVRQDLLEADAKALARTLRSRLLAPLVRFHFGNEPVPRFRFVVEEKEDLERHSKVLVNLTQAGFGSHIPVSYVHEKFGIPKPEDGEQTLVGAIHESPLHELSKQGIDTEFKGRAPKMASQARGYKQQPVNAVLGARMEFIPTAHSFEVFAGSSEDKELETLSRYLDKAAEGIMEELLSPVFEFAKESSSFEELKAKLFQLYPSLSSNQLEEVLQKIIFLADIWGQLNAKD